MHISTQKRYYIAGIAAMGLLASACGGASSGTAPRSAGSSNTTTASGSGQSTTTSGGTATVDMGTAPDSLDPQFAYTTEAGEALSLAYTPLLTYAHKNGSAGTQLIPGLATALPTVTDGGLTYNMTLRSGLKFSDGTPVKASDFTYAIERLLKLNFGGDSFFSANIQGAAAYLAGTATTISGITTNDNTGQITIQLVAPYGAFENVLAFPAAAPIPAGTPMTTQTQPPPGVGSYIVKNVVPNVGFEMVKNPLFASFHIPGIPVGYLNTIKVNIVSNTTTEAEQVLTNQADNFDTFDTIPAALLSEIKSQAGSRFAMEPVESTQYMFLNESRAPFNNILAREAVNIAVDRQAFVRLAGGSITPDCYLLPVGIVGHPTAPCPYGSVDSGDISKAKALVAQAHLVGSPVTVWGQASSPVQQYVEYYTSVLNEIGFNAKIQLITGSTYYPTIGSRAADPQTGYSAWSEDFPNPIDFYLLVNAKSIQAKGNRDRSYVNDPHIQSELATLGAVPTSKLSTVASQWTALDSYVAKQADELIIGYPQNPKFMSNRINFKTAVYSLINGNDWSTWQLNS